MTAHLMDRAPFIRIAVLAAVLLLLAPNFGGAQSSQPLTAVIAYHNDVDNLNPMFAAGGLVQLGSVYDSLIDLDKELKIVPGLAISWRMVNETIWELKLRRGVRFHNGELFSAEDVKFSFDYMMSEGTPAGARRVFTGWFDKLEVVDAYTVRVHTKQPTPVAIHQLASAKYILPRDYFMKVGPEGFAEKPVGTGPYRIVEWRRNQFLRLEAFNRFWGGKPEVDVIVWRIIPAESARVAALLTGEVDMVLQLSPDRVAEVQRAGLKVDNRPGNDIQWVGINRRSAPIDNALVRRAMVHAVDVPAMLKGIMLGYGRIANTIVQQESVGWNPDVKPYTYDPELARNLLRQAGYPNGFRTTIHLSEALWPKHKDIAVAISGYLARIGIVADVDVREWGDYFSKYLKSELDGLHLFGNVGIHSIENLRLNVGSPSIGGQALFLPSEEKDRLIAAASTTLDQQRMLTMLRRVQQIMYDEAAILPLWQYDQIAAYNPKKISWRVRPDRRVDLETIKRAR